MAEKLLGEEQVSGLAPEVVRRRVPKLVPAAECFPSVVGAALYQYLVPNDTL
jgi:hypothetical protein